MKARCADCKHWDYAKGNFGFCRFNAPSPSVVKGKTIDEYTLVWPSTGRDDFCSEYDAVRDLKAV